MSLKILSREDRLKTITGVTVVVAGVAGIGKTRLLTTIDKPTFCFDLENGLTSVTDWKGESSKINTWNSLRDVACLIGGPDPAVGADQPYSQKHYEYALDKEKDTAQKLSHCQCIFFDTLTAAARLCLKWVRLQKVNEWSVFAKFGDEMIDWLIQLQQIKDKDIIFTAGFEKSLDEFQRPIWGIQCSGNKTPNAIPGIVDEVISMVGIKKDDGTEVRSFVCQTLNPWGYPAKDRSGCLNMVEEPHLGKLLAKIKARALSTAA